MLCVECQQVPVHWGLVLGLVLGLGTGGTQESHADVLAFSTSSPRENDELTHMFWLQPLWTSPDPSANLHSNAKRTPWALAPQAGLAWPPSS